MRVRAWRAANPGYARRRRALQEDSSTQVVDATGKTGSLTTTALQEDCHAQGLVLTGLIATLTGTALQEDIARTRRRYRQLALDIFQGDPRDGAQTRAATRAPAQLDPARQALIDADPIAYETPLYQVLSPGPPGRAPVDPPGPWTAPARRAVARSGGRLMIDYDTYRRIHHLHRAEGLNVAQIARSLAMDPRTVREWLDEPTFRPRKKGAAAQQARSLQARHPPMAGAPSVQRHADLPTPAAKRDTKAASASCASTCGACARGRRRRF